METRIFKWISRIWSRGEKYKAEKIEERTKLWPILMSILKNGKEKLFQKYYVFLPMR